jgi:hypothetical protein
VGTNFMGGPSICRSIEFICSDVGMKSGTGGDSCDIMRYQRKTLILQDKLINLARSINVVHT